MRKEGWSCEPFSGPFAVGAGPFRVRGTVLSGALDRIERRVPGGFAAVREAIGEPAVLAFFEDAIFLASALYDIVPLIHLVRALARLAGQSTDQLVRSGAKSAAERDVQSLYRAQMKSASPEEMASRLPRIFNRYFEPSRAEEVSVGPGVMETRFERLPAPYAGYYVWSNEGFIEGALGASGARDVRCVFSGPTPDGEISGIPLVRVGCKITWTAGV